MNSKYSILIAIILLYTPLTKAQSIDKNTKKAITGYFVNYKPKGITIGNCNLSKNKNNLILNKKKKTLTILTNDNFGSQLFTPQLVESIYDEIQSLLPSSLKKYRIIIFINDKSIEELIPNHLREKNIDKSRLWDNEYRGAPWTRRITRPYKISNGLQNRHIATWQSHGRFFKNEENIWKWQRPNLFCTTEDLFTQSFVVPFLIPMLENAGAVVYTPRERDWQSNSVIVDNDVTPLDGSIYNEEEKKATWSSTMYGFAQIQEQMSDGYNPFLEGTARWTKTISDNKDATASLQWIPDIPQTGDYAVYVSYQTLKNSIPDAKYTVVHKGGLSVFNVNQQMGSGTWVYLGTFRFDKGVSAGQMVILTNESGKEDGVVCGDAVRFGGGMGCVARGDSFQVSGMPCYLEGARYASLTNGFPYSIYSPREGENDYTDDINVRSLVVNYLAGGSVYNPDSLGLSVPIELSFGFHSDAGIPSTGDYLGTLGIVTTDYNQKTLPKGLSRFTSRDLAHRVLSNIQRDVNANSSSAWNIRGIWDRNYSESRLPVVPSMILESLSHQNFKDMKLGHDPNFKFTMARAVYKSMLQYISYEHGTKCVVQPLPVKNFRIEFNTQKNNSIVVRWDPVADPLEPDAEADEYILYTRINENGFDDGVKVKDNICHVNIRPGIIYSFKVTAINKGGESFPSEILSACQSDSALGTLLIVNHFHRLSGPATIDNERQQGFLLYDEAPIAYRYTPEYCGGQTNFNPTLAGTEDGLGLSGSELEGKLLAGNTFDYTYLHGKSIAARHYSFVSCSSEAVDAELIELERYPMLDLVLGMEKEQPDGCVPFNSSYPYKTFTPSVQQQLTRYCKNGGSLFLSGAYMASDMQNSDIEQHFIQNTLKFDYGGSNTKLSESIIFGSNLYMEIPRTPNEKCYAVSNPDILIPVSPAFAAFVYNDSRQSAGIGYAGKYRVLATAFPFESIQNEEQRTLLMGSVLKFLLPANHQTK